MTLEGEATRIQFNTDCSLKHKSHKLKKNEIQENKIGRKFLPGREKNFISSR